MRPALSAGCALLLCANLASAQDPAAPRKEAAAVKVPNGAIRVDGRLDEEIWLGAHPITDFTQKEPIEGAPPSDQMEVRFAYDDGALYVGARMYTRTERVVQAPLGRRDNSDQSENVQIWLDTFYDRRTAAMFGVTASGVRLDRFHPTDSEEEPDEGFDPVWEARTSIGPDGWVAELWIPFSQLRFNPQTEQVWGLNVRRFRPTLDEQDYWVLVPRTERVFVSRFGDLQGISGVRPTRRIEILPYIAGASTFNANRDPRNPFDTGANLQSRVGADVKMGLGPNLTLEATVNPDFGQVEADPAEVNLTAFETRFPERRPFFLEGSQLFSIAHPNFYYSRRIGARPIGPASGDYVDYPSTSTIVAAAKLTGRLPSRTSIGFISATTDAESARLGTLAGATITKVPVGPRAFWNVGRVQQEFGRAGNTAGVLFSSVHRDVSAGDPLADLVTRNAMALAGDTNMRFKDGEYEFKFVGGGSFLNGEPGAVERWQRSSSEYAQRPDREYARLDPTLTSLAGWSVQSTFDRVGGRHWLFGVYTKIDSARFETNDIANLTGADGARLRGDIRYRETRPNRVLRNYSIGFQQDNDWTLGGGERQSGSLRPSLNLTWANFWTTSISYSRLLEGESVSLTRGGPIMLYPDGWSSTINIGNRSTSQTRWSLRFDTGGDEDGGTTRRVSGTFSFRPGPRWQLSASPFVDRVTNTQQYVSTVAGGRPDTYGSRYVFAWIDRSTVSTELRMSLTLKPDMNLDVYAEPFAASGRYYDFGELADAGTRERIAYGKAPGTSFTTLADGSRAVVAGDQRFTVRSRDFNTLSFRSNVVLRWEWRAGSTLYVVWQQDRSNTDVLGSYVSVADMFRSLSAPGSNFFTVKTSFWLPIK